MNMKSSPVRSVDYMENIQVPVQWDQIPESLPDIKDEDNPIVWCERCRKHHKYWTFTKQDYLAMMQDQVKKLAANIAEKALEEAYAEARELS